MSSLSYYQRFRAEGPRRAQFPEVWQGGAGAGSRPGPAGDGNRSETCDEAAKSCPGIDEDGRPPAVRPSTRAACCDAALGSHHRNWSCSRSSPARSVELNPELAEQTGRIDVMIWAHVDQTGFALFEEAHQHGVRAAETVADALGVGRGESWL